MPKIFQCRQPLFVYKNPKYREDERGKPIDENERYSVWVKPTFKEYDLIIEYARAASAAKQKKEKQQHQKKKKDKKSKEPLLPLEQRYQREIVNKQIDGVDKVHYAMCHGGCSRVYRRSRPDEEGEPRRVETGGKYRLAADGSEHNETVNVRRRKFVPLGFYCHSCGATTPDEEYDVLEFEERKVAIRKAFYWDEIVQGYDNQGYF
jgi:hypothetical protein